MASVTLPYPLVLVEWADAHTSEGGWQDLETLADDEECVIQSVGFMIPEGEPGGKTGHVSLWQTYKEPEGVHGFYVPSAMVRRVIILSPILDNVTPDL
jgi:hypothetical protein